MSQDDSYLINYNTNGGDTELEPQEKIYNINIKLHETIPIKQGYKFVGWGLNENSQSVSYSPGEIYIRNKSLNLFAIWVENDIEFDDFYILNKDNSIVEDIKINLKGW